MQELLRLSDAIGEAKERGLKYDDVQRLPCYSQSDTHSALICVICLDAFSVGQVIRALPCCHEYHAKCVDRWLTVRTHSERFKRVARTELSYNLLRRSRSLKEMIYAASCWYQSSAHMRLPVSE